MKLQHFLVFETDENGVSSDAVSGRSPVALMSFDEKDIPEGYLNRARFLRKHAAGQVGHNFTLSVPVTRFELNRFIDTHKEHVKTFESFLRQATATEKVLYDRYGETC